MIDCDAASLSDGNSKIFGVTQPLAAISFTLAPIALTKAPAPPSSRIHLCRYRNGKRRDRA
jgi:hypothetical protein